MLGAVQKGLSFVCAMIFRHTFQNGQKFFFVGDLKKKPPEFRATPVPKDCQAEYRRWREEVGIPVVFSHDGMEDIAASYAALRAFAGLPPFPRKGAPHGK